MAKVKYLNEDEVRRIVNETIKEVLNGEKPNNFLHEIYCLGPKKGELRSINENNIKRMINKHSEDGYIVISACRGAGDFGLDLGIQKDKDEFNHINIERTRNLIELLKQSGYAYTPVYGGFIENQGEENEEIVYERSFIVYNHDRKGKKLNFDDLKHFGEEMGAKFNQESILVSPPNGAPKFISTKPKNFGEETLSFPNGATFNDLSQPFFTDLHKNTEKFTDMDKRRPTRVSFHEAYVNPKPDMRYEDMYRYYSGEVFE